MFGVQTATARAGFITVAAVAQIQITTMIHIMIPKTTTTTIPYQLPTPPHTQKHHADDRPVTVQANSVHTLLYELNVAFKKTTENSWFTGGGNRRALFYPNLLHSDFENSRAFRPVSQNKLYAFRLTLGWAHSSPPCDCENSRAFRPKRGQVRIQEAKL